MEMGKLYNIGKPIIVYMWCMWWPNNHHLPPPPRTNNDCLLYIIWMYHLLNALFMCVYTFVSGVCVCVLGYLGRIDIPLKSIENRSICLGWCCVYYVLISILIFYRNILPYYWNLFFQVYPLCVPRKCLLIMHVFENKKKYYRLVEK